MKDPITFTMDADLKDAIKKLSAASRSGGNKMDIELKGQVVNGEVVITQIDSSLKARSAPHCWHALSEKAERGEL